ncbi:glycoside hydrolase family 97 protein [Haloprofundus salilacus]|uniref:glycoside hydrolase family 97 protein n=1 Tax=Haloprofundus salilacus TaxID=2876190 RepID=UPI001CC986F3|nr:glycoside hydrolase family 97 protein [Haloprofundus salilacus]
MQTHAPSTGLVATLDVPTDARPTLSISRDGRTVLDQSPLGIETLDREYTDLTYETLERRSFERRYETPVGKRREHAIEMNESTATLSTAAGDRIEIDVRVSDDAVGYRYRLPGDGSVVVTDEVSRFELPDDAAAWAMPAEAKHEGVFRETTAAETEGDLGYPVLFDLGEDWLFLAETDVDGRYCATTLSTEAGETGFDVTFPDAAMYRNGSAPEEISARRPLTTPWRLAVVGDLDDVVRSDAVADFVDADGRGVDPQSVIPEWVDPGRVAWSWWSDGFSPSDEERQREFVDYATERGWEYVLVDDGWGREWMAELVEYAEAHDVGVFVWSRYSWLDTPEKRDQRLGKWVDFGVRGVKVDFMNSDTQQMMRFYDELAAATADHGLMLNVHGSITPKGLRRRWPHLLTYEGVHGAENYHPIPQTIEPSHNVTLPFTRNVLGPMDYTPVTLSAETRQTGLGHELALSVVYESGLQHFADSIESYANTPAAEWFLERVPAVWDEIAFVGGRPADRASIARRNDDEWYLGTITAGESRLVTCPLSFLADGTYEATVVREDDDGEALVREERTVTAMDELTVTVVENGGFACLLAPSE